MLKSISVEIAVILIISMIIIVAFELGYQMGFSFGYKTARYDSIQKDIRAPHVVEDTMASPIK